MTFYECYLFGRDGEIAGCEQIERDGEASAIVMCRQILAARPRYASFELWQFKRKIHVEGRRQPIALFAVPRRDESGAMPPPGTVCLSFWSLCGAADRQAGAAGAAGALPEEMAVGVALAE